MSESRVRAALKLIDTKLKTKLSIGLASHRKKIDAAAERYKKATLAASKKINEALKVTAKKFGAEIDDLSFHFEEARHGWTLGNKANYRLHPEVVAAMKDRTTANEAYNDAYSAHEAEAESIKQLIVMNGLTDDVLARLKAFIGE